MPPQPSRLQRQYLRIQGMTGSNFAINDGEPDDRRHDFSQCYVFLLGSRALKSTRKIMGH